VTAPLGAVDLGAWQAMTQSLRRGASAEDSALARLAGLSFEATVAEALAQAGPEHLAEAAAAVEEPELSAGGSAAPAPAADAPGRSTALPQREEHAIIRESARTGVDPSLLVALRRTENGGPGREFGVLSVAAPDLDAQARVAANTVRNSIQRFERGGQAALDPATGRYTEEFLRYLSARYAPIGAANDPAGLNRHHAANLIGLYQKVATRGGES
jgi:hypothetical protein